MTGAKLIAAERKRQIEVEDWTAAHDDGHAKGQLTAAAMHYAAVAEFITATGRDDGKRFFRGHPILYHPLWPWKREWFKPDWADPIRNLVKAGALIAAEIDRLQRKAE